GAGRAPDRLRRVRRPGLFRPGPAGLSIRPRSGRRATAGTGFAIGLTMNERQLQFRVGLLVVTAGIVAAGLVFRFGELRWLWGKTYTIGVHFQRAPGVQRRRPGRKNGILIGAVRAVTFDENRGGVNLVVEIRERFQLRKDSRPALTRSLLGDATLEFTPGTSRDLLRPGDRIEGA